MTTVRPPFDPEIAHVLATRTDVVRALHPDEIPALRARSGAVQALPATAPTRLERRRHDVNGRQISFVLLRPADAHAALPVLYFVHGGGLVVGTASDDAPALARLAEELQIAVVSVEYRLAPEHRYPAAVDDVYDGLHEVHAHAERWGMDPERIVLGGVSAGGGLAAATALRLRDEGGPRILGQYLLCPMLDDRNDSPSARQMEGAGAWDRRANATGWAAYLGPDAGEVPIYAAPGRATDLSGLPPTFLDVGSAETFRDEVTDYARRLWRDGGDAELHVWAGGAHGFDALAPEARITRAAQRARRSWLARRFFSIGP